MPRAGTPRPPGGSTPHALLHRNSAAARATGVASLTAPAKIASQMRRSTNSRADILQLLLRRSALVDGTRLCRGGASVGYGEGQCRHEQHQCLDDDRKSTGKRHDFRPRQPVPPAANRIGRSTPPSTQRHCPAPPARCRSARAASPTRSFPLRIAEFLKQGRNRVRGLTHQREKSSDRIFTIMVPRAGIEPATHGFSVRCSTN